MTLFTYLLDHNIFYTLFHVQMWTSALREHTTAVLTPTVPTRKDLTRVHADLGTLVTDLLAHLQVGRNIK